MKSQTVLLMMFAAVTGRAQTTEPAEQGQSETMTIPYFGVFDNIQYQLNGTTAILSGQVTRPNLKRSAETFVSFIPGVEKIENQIEVLPASASDDDLRAALYAAIYGNLSVEVYDCAVVKPLRIIVKEGSVTLEGAVNSEHDDSVAKAQAATVPGVLSVTDHLRVTNLLGTGAGKQATLSAAPYAAVCP
jgi:hyperosmotically inducible protein